jgi:transcriptional regulator of acetoin/glycerol metabolism
MTLAELEAKAIAAILKKRNFNMTEVAKELGISRATLYRKMKQYDIKQDKPDGKPDENNGTGL